MTTSQSTTTATYSDRPSIRSSLPYSSKRPAFHCAERQVRCSRKGQANLGREPGEICHPCAAAGGAGADRRDPRQLRRSRERPLDRPAGRAQRSPQAIRVLPRQAADLRGVRMSEAKPHCATSRSRSARRARSSRSSSRNRRPRRPTSPRPSWSGVHQASCKSQAYEYLPINERGAPRSRTCAPSLRH